MRRRVLYRVCKSVSIATADTDGRHALKELGYMSAKRPWHIGLVTKVGHGPPQVLHFRKKLSDHGRGNFAILPLVSENGSRQNY